MDNALMPRPCRRSIHSAAQQYSGQLPSRPAPACYINPLSGHQLLSSRCVRSRLEKSQIVKHGRVLSLELEFSLISIPTVHFLSKRGCFARIGATIAIIVTIVQH
ncbi:hypothetical protein T4A_13171 [Trichinella pseudospiralis]|uniref:Uncharacterized protein n=1 Tax=Trichinella pseudospiralis TaxID=6337 RepID=A0A0V1EYK1_TRIPS|nr:hypothetical protein T4A_13171 [Trichinella pseudospiralis]